MQGRGPAGDVDWRSLSVADVPLLGKSTVSGPERVAERRDWQKGKGKKEDA